jgi:MYXO-CTERM domain-containing protein
VNEQDAAVAAPMAASRSASNDAALIAQTTGSAVMQSGAAFVGPSPTPTLVPRREDGRGVQPQVPKTSPQTRQQTSQTDSQPAQPAAQAGAKDKLLADSVDYDPWTAWRARELPPMPGQKPRDPRPVAQEFDPFVDWPALGFPPMPGQFVIARQLPPMPPLKLGGADSITRAVSPLAAPVVEETQAENAIDEHAPATFDEQVLVQREAPMGASSNDDGGTPFPIGFVIAVMLALAAIAAAAWRRRRTLREWIERRGGVPSPA